MAKGGNDNLVGNGGDDYLDGGAGDDSLDGGDGNDTLVSESGSDVYFGGDGDDTLNSYAGASLKLDAAASIETLDTLGNNFTGTIGANLFDVTAMLVNVWDASFNMGAGIDTFSGSVLGDEVYGEGGNDNLVGNGGDDYLDGGTGDDSLDGGDGNDTLVSESGSDVYFGGDGDDTLISYTGASLKLDAAASIETLDTLGNNFTGTIGANLFDVTAMLVNVWSASFNMGAGIDTFSGSVLGDEVYGEGGNDNLVGNGGDDYLDGGTGDDSLDGGDGNDTLVSESGSDVYFGGDGDDTLISYAGASLKLDAAASIETLDTLGNNFTGTIGANLFDVTAMLVNVWSASFNMGAGIDTFSGSVLGDEVYGEGGNDNLVGNGGDDNLDGGDGNDVIDGGAGNDTMTGGLGNDIYVVDSMSDNIVELAGGGLADRVQASTSFTLAAGDDVEYLQTTDENLTTAINLTGNELAQTITGNAGANVLNGGIDDVKDVLAGGYGDDTYIINSGTDNITEYFGRGRG